MKSKTRSPLSLALAITCLCIAPLPAQNRGAGDNVSMHIDFVSWGEDLSGLEVRDAKGGTPVSALAFRYSEPLKYKGSQTLALALVEATGEAKLQKPGETGEWRRLGEEGGVLPGAILEAEAGQQEAGGEIPKSLAKAREEDPALAALVKLPANSRRVTILLAPGPDRSLLPHVFDDDPARQPPGMVRVHNFSPHPISLLLADGKVRELASGKDFLAPAPRGVFAYELAYKIKDKWKVQENNLVNVRNDQQLHMVVLRNGSSFFSSSDGSRGGFMQTALLRRSPQPAKKQDAE